MWYVNTTESTAGVVPPAMMPPFTCVAHAMTGCYLRMWMAAASLTDLDGINGVNRRPSTRTGGGRIPSREWFR
jgi:hypothetical protein